MTVSLLFTVLIPVSCIVIQIDVCPIISFTNLNISHTKLFKLLLFLKNIPEPVIELTLHCNSRVEIIEFQII